MTTGQKHTSNPSKTEIQNFSFSAFSQFLGLDEPSGPVATRRANLIVSVRSKNRVFRAWIQLLEYALGNVLLPMRETLNSWGLLTALRSLHGHLLITITIRRPRHYLRIPLHRTVLIRLLAKARAKPRWKASLRRINLVMMTKRLYKAPPRRPYDHQGQLLPIIKGRSHILYDTDSFECYALTKLPLVRVRQPMSSVFCNVLLVTYLIFDILHLSWFRTPRPGCYHSCFGYCTVRAPGSRILRSSVTHVRVCKDRRHCRVAT